MNNCSIYDNLVNFTLHLIIDVSKMLEAPSTVDLINQYECMTNKKAFDDSKLLKFRQTSGA